LKIADGAYVVDTSEYDAAGVTKIVIDRIEDLDAPRSETMVRPKLYRAACNVLGFGLKVMNDIKVVGLKNVPKTGGLIIASNHASYIDPPAIGSFCRMRTIHFMARSTLFKGFMDWFLTGVGVISLDRERGGDLKAMKTAIQLLHHGGAVSLFPEGTRTEDGNLQAAKPGIGFLVAKGNSPVVPVYIHGSYEAMSKHSGGWKKVPVTVIFGQLITQEEIQGLGSGREAYGKIGELIMQRIADLKAKFEKGQIDE
jgi:1-acyl-sn-glycerol-3-phosphate acyltransferase